MAHRAVVERASRAPATVIALDRDLENLPRYWPFGLRFQVVNEAPYSWRWEPRLEWSADGVTYELVSEEIETGVPFRLAEARNATDGDVIPPKDFVLPSEAGHAQAGVLYETANPAQAWTLGASAVTEVEMVVRATRDADWKGTYYFRLVDNGCAPSSGDPQLIVIARRPPPPTPVPRPTETAGRERAPALSWLHGDLAPDPAACAGCHRVHTASEPELMLATGPDLCLSCHDGSGANTDVLAEYEDPSIPPNDEENLVFYSHAMTAGDSADAAALEGQLHRVSTCTDCHNPHTLTSDRPTSTAAGWTAPGALHGATGVALTPTPYAWTEAIDYEYELCLKCHSAFTELLTSAKPSQQKTDKLQDIDPDAPGSYHPVAAPGTNDSPEMALSLEGGSLWQFGTGDTVRCVNCHARSTLLEGGSTLPPADRLAPHVSRYPSLLIAEYRSRPLKPPADDNDYDAAEFALCFLCHSAAPFADRSGDARSDTRFPMHGFHLNKLFDEYEEGGTPSLDIDEPGAGGGNAICAECHFRIHSTRFAVNDGDKDNGRLVNFAPNVLPESRSADEPVWALDPQNSERGSCTLTCHNERHKNEEYKD